ncbi:MAG TPA: pyridoxal phosphate-dependent aminotransferase, partial [Candidatus Polarisedimenticolaceae bacterium]|nr:pyridoxal phosphate-dependent aminotransferase [Candidatus Polarisedimenticolaceae bacterium]
MPAHPAVGRIADTLVDSVFSSLAGRLDSRGGPVYPLHIGDSWLDPADGCRMEDLTVAAHPGLHRYTPTRGLPRLVHAIAARVAERSGIDTGPENVLVSAGATAGLTAVMHTILDPGDEVLILAPYWPLIRGIVLCAHGVPTPVPILGRVATSDELIEALERARTPRSVAVYLSTPNNPSGGVLPRGWVDGLADWATSRGLWIVSDEVYEDHVFEGEHRPA